MVCQAYDVRESQLVRWHSVRVCCDSWLHSTAKLKTSLKTLYDISVLSEYFNTVSTRDLKHFQALCGLADTCLSSTFPDPSTFASHASKYHMISGTCTCREHMFSRIFAAVSGVGSVMGPSGLGTNAVDYGHSLC
jgi:hypothetical protein